MTDRFLFVLTKKRAEMRELDSANAALRAQKSVADADADAALAAQKADADAALAAQKADADAALAAQKADADAALVAQKAEIEALAAEVASLRPLAHIAGDPARQVGLDCFVRRPGQHKPRPDSDYARRIGILNTVSESLFAGGSKLFEYARQVVQKPDVLWIVPGFSRWIGEVINKATRATMYSVPEFLRNYIGRLRAEISGRKAKRLADATARQANPLTGVSRPLEIEVSKYLSINRASHAATRYADKKAVEYLSDTYGAYLPPAEPLEVGGRTIGVLYDPYKCIELFAGLVLFVPAYSSVYTELDLAQLIFCLFIDGFPRNKRAGRDAIQASFSVQRQHRVSLLYIGLVSTLSKKY
jgi:hypothetical protein